MVRPLMKSPHLPHLSPPRFSTWGNPRVPTSPPSPPPIEGGSGGGGDTLLVLADRVRRLSPHHRDPERFHEDKSEIERELRRLARRVANG